MSDKQRDHAAEGRTHAEHETAHPASREEHAAASASEKAGRAAEGEWLGPESDGASAGATGARAETAASTAAADERHEPASAAPGDEQDAARVFDGEREASAHAGTDTAVSDLENDPVVLWARIEQLESELTEARHQADTHRDQVLRLRAEVENTQRRAQKDVAQARRQGLERVAADLLQVKDSLEMGVQAAEEQEADREKLLEGTQLTLKLLTQVFERFQIEPIDPQGERFNPEYHEAMATQPSSEQDPNTVLHVVQKGYRLEERLLRPALVVVAKRADDSSGGHSGGTVDETA
ncbi:nucleotide exchange factor GrpE [Halorhodospira abdelmalekii]|uniref:nucleotide exchange factor GrpE n=1 Tax=Halorhodospira abdelmalekii TaxID=421629 RepID=UPI00190704DD|nr:nucleotide exchange factor GrpE [Halorhodospira abdelmalekii]MBK1735104.1 nucleotide exchange factor GrpE [Halorhodospira abdelmalekii]